MREAGPIYIAITPGQRHEMMKADELLANAPGKAFIADAGYDFNRFRQAIRDKKKRAVIGSKPKRRRKLPKSRALYSKRCLAECFFLNLKRFRAKRAVQRHWRFAGLLEEVARCRFSEADGSARRPRDHRAARLLQRQPTGLFRPARCSWQSKPG